MSALIYASALAGLAAWAWTAARIWARTGRAS